MIYWIVFEQTNRWFSGFCKKGFSHCYIITHDGYGWLKINPGLNRMEFQMLAYEMDEDVPRYIKAYTKTRILKVVKNLSTPSSYRPWFLLHFTPCICAQMVKYIIGINIMASTPYKLYKRLVHMSPYDQATQSIDSISEII